MKSLTLYAPACTTELFKTNIIPYVGRGGCVEQLAIFNLKDKVERDDNVAKLYHKSLLYLVSEAFESKRKQPLLGMDKFIEKDADIRVFLGKAMAQRSQTPTSVYSVGGVEVSLKSKSTSHGGFDNDEDTLNSTLRIITGQTDLKKEFESNDS